MDYVPSDSICAVADALGILRLTYRFGVRASRWVERELCTLNPSKATPQNFEVLDTYLDRATDLLSVFFVRAMFPKRLKHLASAPPREPQKKWVTGMGRSRLTGR